MKRFLIFAWVTPVIIACGILGLGIFEAGAANLPWKVVAGGGTCAGIWYYRDSHGLQVSSLPIYRLSGVHSKDARISY
jgi:hypothetical protein